MAGEIGAEHCAHILHDSYYRDLSHLEPAERTDVNYDHPDSLETELLVEHLHALMHGAAVAADLRFMRRLERDINERARITFVYIPAG